MSDQAKTLLTKEDHIAGSKLIEVVMKWGEQVEITVRAIGWRETQALLQRAQQEKWGEARSAEEMIRASIVGQVSDRLLDHLDGESAVRLQQYVNAFTFGENRSGR
jgi:hypothetical protein